MTRQSQDSTLYPWLELASGEDLADTSDELPGPAHR